MSNRPAALLIEDIWEAIEKIERYTSGITKNAFTEDERTADAVARNLEIIGEAAARLPQDFRDGSTTIEWHKIIGLRNRIVHGYFGVDLDIIWLIIQNDLPVFKIALVPIRNSVQQ